MPKNNRQKPRKKKSPEALIKAIEEGNDDDIVDDPKNPNKGHRIRMKRKFMRAGLEFFEDHEVLELLLFYCVTQQDTNKLAHRMLDEFGSLVNILELDWRDLIMLGLTENKAAFIRLVAEVNQRYHFEKAQRGIPLKTSDALGQLAKSWLMAERYEAVAAIFLDMNFRLLRVQKICEGSFHQVDVNLRKIVEATFRHGAQYVAIVHNHPGGTMEPSERDIESTRKIRNTMNGLSTYLIDHIIIADGKYISFAERNLMDAIEGYND